VRSMLLFFMRVLYQRREGLSRGNLDFLSVEQVQHHREAVELGAVEAGEGSTVGVENVVVVRGGGFDELEHLALVSEPLKDVGVVVTRRPLGESLAFFHACIIPCPGQNARGKEKNFFA
jgi:hypothetical protein